MNSQQEYDSQQLLKYFMYDILKIYMYIKLNAWRIKDILLKLGNQKLSKITFRKLCEKYLF